MIDEVSRDVDDLMMRVAREGGKLSAKALYAAVQKVMAKINTGEATIELGAGLVTEEDLLSQGVKLEEIEINDGGNGELLVWNECCRKRGVSYFARRDPENDVYYIGFKAKDHVAIEDAFREYSERFPLTMQEPERAEEHQAEVKAPGEKTAESPERDVPPGGTRDSASQTAEEPLAIEEGDRQRVTKEEVEQIAEAEKEKGVNIRMEQAARTTDAGRNVPQKRKREKLWGPGGRVERARAEAARRNAETREKQKDLTKDKTMHRELER